MFEIVRDTLARRASAATRDGVPPVREELFKVERLEQHGESLAAARLIAERPPFVRSLPASRAHELTTTLVKDGS